MGISALAQTDVWAPDLAVWGDDPVPGSQPLNSVLFLLVTAPVAWRRSAPLAATCVAMAAVAVQAVTSQDAPIGLLLVAPGLALVYAVGCYADRVRGWIGLGVTACATAVHDAFDAQIRTAQDVGEASYWWLVLGSTWLAGRYVASRRRTREAQEAEAEAVAAERLRIANELHDVVAHGVSAIALQAGAALELLDRSPERARAPLEAIERTARESLVEMGALVGILRQGEEPAAAQPSLRQLPAMVDRARAAGLAVEVRTVGEARTLPPGIELSAYRIVQEAVTNALKHAGRGGRAVVLVEHRSDELRLTVTSTGEPSGVTEGRGHGLVGMRERTALYGGTVHARPTSDGFVVEASLPLRGEPTRRAVLP